MVGRSLPTPFNRNLLLEIYQKLLRDSSLANENMTEGKHLRLTAKHTAAHSQSCGQTERSMKLAATQSCRAELGITAVHTDRCAPQTLVAWVSWVVV